MEHPPPFTITIDIIVNSTPISQFGKATHNIPIISPEVVPMTVKLLFTI